MAKSGQRFGHLQLPGGTRLIDDKHVSKALGVYDVCRRLGCYRVRNAYPGQLRESLRPMADLPGGASHTAYSQNTDRFYRVFGNHRLMGQMRSRRDRLTDITMVA